LTGIAVQEYRPNLGTQVEESGVVMQVSRGAEVASPDAGSVELPSECRCGGTGAYTVNIAIAGAVVSDQRMCVEHGLYPRARVYDTNHCRTGVVMEVTKNIMGLFAWLRPEDGGTEWQTSVGSLRPPQDAA
jgi:hypothetical protein